MDIPYKERFRDPSRFEWWAIEIFIKERLSEYCASFPQASLVPVDYDMSSPVLRSGKDLAYEAVIDQIPVALEDELTWRQVLEFKQDKESVRKYRDLHLWIEQVLSSQSDQQRVDVIGQKLEDYRWALRKYGIKTKLAALTTFISALGAGIPAGGFVARAANVKAEWGMAAGVALTIAGGSAWIAQQLLELKDLGRGAHREVAYLHDVQKLVKQD